MYIQEEFRKLVPTVVRESTPPRVFKPRLPPIKDHMIKDHLTQKANLRCKTPRPGSVYDRSMAVIASASEQANKTRHPLKVSKEVLFSIRNK